MAVSRSWQRLGRTWARLGRSVLVRSVMGPPCSSCPPGWCCDCCCSSHPPAGSRSCPQSYQCLPTSSSLPSVAADVGLQRPLKRQMPTGGQRLCWVTAAFDGNGMACYGQSYGNFLPLSATLASLFKLSCSPSCNSAHTLPSFGPPNRGMLASCHSGALCK